MGPLQFALLGLGAGGVYALTALGVVVVYRGSGVLNFAQGAIGMTGAFVFYDLQSSAGWPLAAAVVAAAAFSATTGIVIHLLVIRRLRDASGLAALIATLAVWLLLRGIAGQVWGFDAQSPNSILPSSRVSLLGTSVGFDRLIVCGVAVVLTIMLGLAYHFTKFGVATEAVAENPVASASIGISPNFVASVNWALGSLLATAGAVLIAPITGLQIDNLILLVIPALAAALIGGFRSYPLTLLGGLALGIAESEISRYVSDPGWTDAAPFLVIIMVLVIRGRALPVRGEPNVRAPEVGTGRISPGWLAAGAVGLALVIFLGSDNWTASLITTFSVGLVILSIVVVTGYCGQLSLAQFAVAGMGAWVASRLVAIYGTPIPVAALIAVVCTVPVGLVIAVPALRTRGMNLAVATLGLAVVIEQLVLLNPNLTGGVSGTHVGDAKLFGWDISGATHPARYAALAGVVFLLAAIGVANVRRGRSGRRFIAIRANERGAAALGVSVVETKMFAFAIAAALAALGGVLAAFQYPFVSFAQFSLFQSIYAVVAAVLGGVGFVVGALLGATLVPGAVGTQIGNAVFGSIQTQLQIITPLVLLVMLRLEPNGLAKLVVRNVATLRRRVRPRVESQPAPPSAARIGPRSATRPATPTDSPKSLRVERLSVAFGSTRVLEDVSFAVKPGMVVGVIGANGAGKTTLIDAITGFVRPSQGAVMLDEVDITRWSPDRRARAGLSRSFQSLELFDSLTVRDNLHVACDSARRLVFLTDFVHPGRQPLSSTANEAVDDFGLGATLDRRPDDLPYGTRRLVAIARAVATSPSVLLLDEPAAGLDDVETAELSILIRRLATEWNLAVIVVEHDMSLVLNTCDRIEVLDHGHHLASGTPEEILDNQAVLDAYLGVDGNDGATEPSADEQHIPVPSDHEHRRRFSASTSSDHSVLRAIRVSAGYGDLAAVRDVDLEVHAGEIVALIGSNGAGKTTTLRALAGQVPLLAGEVRWNDRPWTAPIHERARQGLAFVPEGRSVFVNLSVAANLRLGRGQAVDALELFPELEPLLSRRGGLLSGGEQQILAVARALGSKPRVLLADELSIGLAPKIVDRLFTRIRQAASDGLAAIVVDQSVERVLDIADRVVVLSRGAVVADEPAIALRGRTAAIFDSFLGASTRDQLAVAGALDDRDGGGWGA